MRITKYVLYIWLKNFCEVFSNQFAILFNIKLNSSQILLYYCRKLRKISRNCFSRLGSRRKLQSIVIIIKISTNRISTNLFNTKLHLWWKIAAKILLRYSKLRLNQIFTTESYGRNSSILFLVLLVWLSAQLR